MPQGLGELKEGLKHIFKREIREISPLPFEEDSSLTGRTSTGQPPISKLRLLFEDGEEREIIVKVKSSKVILNGIKLLNFNRRLRLYYYLARFHGILSFDHSFIRELAFYDHIGGDYSDLLPEVYGTYHRRRGNRYLIAMREFPSPLNPTKEEAYIVLDAILRFHIGHYADKALIDKFKLNYYSHEDYKRARPLLNHLFRELDEENIIYYGEDLPLLHRFISEIHERRARLREHYSLTHNDFSPRNMCLHGDGLIIYDWELACYQFPEHDLIEYLSFVIGAYTDAEVLALIAYYRRGLTQALNLSFEDKEYQDILEFNICEFIVNKLSVYRRAHKTYELDFIEDLCLGTARLLRLIREQGA